MPKGYWISRVDVPDADAYKPYADAAPAAIAAFGGRFLVRGGAFEALEPPARARNVVVEFPDYETALACYASPAYQAAYVHRLAAAAGSDDMIVIEGYEGVQPAASVIDGPPAGPGAAYWVMRIDVHDMETYKSYIAGDAAAVEKYRGWFLVRGGRFEVKAGTARSRNVVLGFESWEAALACYNSPEYQAALAFRKQAAQAEAIAIRGA